MHAWQNVLVFLSLGDSECWLEEIYELKMLAFALVNNLPKWFAVVFKESI